MEQETLQNSLFSVLVALLPLWFAFVVFEMKKRKGCIVTHTFV